MLIGVKVFNPHKAVFSQNYGQTYAATLSYPSGGNIIAKRLNYSYFIPDNDASLASLAKNISSLDGVMVDALRLNDDIVSPFSSASVSNGYNLVRSQKRPVKVYALISNYAKGAWQKKATASTLHSSDRRKKVIASLVEYADVNKLSGISLDFEELDSQSQPDLIAFCAELQKALRPSRRSLFIHVPADNEAWNYKAISNNVDEVILMNYDQHWSTSTPGAIAELNWFEQSIQKITAQVPPQKLIVGIANYAYDWVGTKAEGITYDTAMQNAKLYNAKITLDNVSKSDTYSYKDRSSKRHVVWLADAQSARYELSLLTKYNISATALYRLGSEDPSVWKLLR
ncbi:MAG: hypothetical protein NVS3B9_6370 [Candidatus Doudnabacteria bacterium]